MTQLSRCALRADHIMICVPMPPHGVPSRLTTTLAVGPTFLSRTSAASDASCWTRLDAGGLHHLAPLEVFFANDPGIFLRGGADCVDADRRHALFEAGRGDDGGSRAMQRVDDVGRGADGRHESHPGPDFDAGEACLRHGRNVRERSDAGCAAEASARSLPSRISGSS